MASAVDLAAAGMHTDGYWGPITATLDWCEANYQFSHYIAEMANACSNVYSIGLAVMGTRNMWQEGLPPTFVLGFVMFGLVGFGSFAFHASLLHGAQLADELPMIYVVAHGLVCLFDTKPGWDMLEDRRTTVLLVGEVVFDVLFTWSYAGVYRNPVYHQSVFAVLIIGIVIRVVYLLHNAEDYTLEDIKEQAPLSSNDTDTEPNNTNTPAVLNTKPARKVVVIPPSARRDIRHCFTVGPSSFALGFLVWNLDNVFCGRLTGWKRALGWPAAFLLEGHSWWHVLTGYGSYLMIVGICYLGVCVKDDYRRWGVRYWWTLPLIENVDKRSA
ncbi:alkaline phytoceramidase [Pterulicium gracile]|uniref:Alkaline phytoceramidase n=1 Tax=Pterulicium gracile TaxID=1884261 RepID=A0A5C3QQV0_9AGAR|nr:alkaline phytoceramidase [Pterula gracilis]